MIINNGELSIQFLHPAYCRYSSGNSVRQGTENRVSPALTFVQKVNKSQNAVSLFHGGF
jgi:hypothetical protein